MALSARGRAFASTCDAAIPMYELTNSPNPRHLRLRTREPQEQSQSPPSRLFRCVTPGKISLQGVSPGEQSQSPLAALSLSHLGVAMPSSQTRFQTGEPQETPSPRQSQAAWSAHQLPKGLQLHVLPQFLAGLLGAELAVLLVDAIVGDAGKLFPHLAVYIVLLHVIDATVAS